MDYIVYQYSVGLHFVAIQFKVEYKYPAIQLKSFLEFHIWISFSSNLFWTTRSGVLWRRTFWGDTGLVDCSFFSVLDCGDVNVQVDDSFLCLFSSRPLGESIKAMRFLSLLLILQQLSFLFSLSNLSRATRLCLLLFMQTRSCSKRFSAIWIKFGWCASSCRWRGVLFFVSVSLLINDLVLPCCCSSSACSGGTVWIKRSITNCWRSVVMNIEYVGRKAFKTSYLEVCGYSRPGTYYLWYIHVQLLQALLR